ncbi:pilus assembly protein PilM [Glaesserella sp.]|uniref:pilus assembly protein PilM n=1 Tax=Glaesserella sp. TaxID=2094731 RepID=UPI00359FBA35
MPFFHLNTVKNRTKAQIGISENVHQFCLVYITEDKVHSFWQQKPCDYNLLLQQAVRFLPKFTVIRPIPHTYIWRKTLFFPINYSAQTLYQQIIQYLTQELPVSIEEIYFDYVTERLVDSEIIRVVIHAVRQCHVDSLLAYSPTILDCELYCFLRGFHYWTAQPLENIRQNVYQISNRLVQFKLDGLETTESSLNDSDKLKQLSQLTWGEDINDPLLFIVALGACLWNGTA